MKLYTKTVCGQCIAVKGAITAKKLEVEIINIDEKPEAKQYLLDNGVMAAPVLEVDGKLIPNLSAIFDYIENQ